MSYPAHQLKHRNFRPGANADWKASGSDAAVDVQLAAAFFVPSAHIRSLGVYEGEAPFLQEDGER